MKRQPITVRVLSGFMSLTMLQQPVMAAEPELTSARQAEKGLLASGVFENADAREAESLAAVWGDYLATFAFCADDLRAVLASETQLTKSMREQLAAWGVLRSELRIEGDAVKLAATVSELERLLRTALDRRDSTIGDLREHVETLAATAQLARDKTADPSVFATAYEFDMTARLLASERALVDRAWNALVAGQAVLLDAAKATKEQFEAGLTPLVSLSEAINAEPAVLARWNEARSTLAATFLKPYKQIDHTREATLLSASHRLASRASEGLRGKADANSKAHAAMADRFALIVEQRMEQLAALATESVEGLRESSFLHVADPASLQGEWAAYALRHQTISSSLVAGLGEADRLFAQHQLTALRTLDTVRLLIGTVVRADAPEQTEALAPLKQGLIECQDVMDRYETALRQLDAVRLSLLGQLTSNGKPAFDQVDLRNRGQAVAYAKLGQIYEAAHALMLELRLELGAVQMLAAAAEGLGVTADSAGLREGLAAFDRYLPGWNTLAEKQRLQLSQLRSLAIAVTGGYARDLSSFSQSLSEAAEGHEGQYSKVLAAMQAKVCHGADVVAGLTTPMLEALGGDSPRITAPVLNWTGAASLQGTLRRTIERGYYFQTTGTKDVATLTLPDKGNGSFTSSLALVDLATALDYPLRVFVAPDGMAIVVGRDGPGAVILGIGNPEQYRLDPNAPTVSVIPDFTAHGVLVGWDWAGGFQNFVRDVGQTVGDTAGAIGHIAGDVAQGVQQFGAQVVDTVGPAVDALAKGAVEVAGFVVDTAADFGQSFLDDPWKLVQYAGYGALVIGTGGAAAPFVAVAIAADIGKSGVNVAEKRGYIDADVANAARLVSDVTQVVAGGLAGGTAITGVSKAATIARIGIGLSATAGVGVEFVDYGELTGALDAETAAWLRLTGRVCKLAGGLMTLEGIMEGATGIDNLKDMFHNLHGFTTGALPGFGFSVVGDAIFRGSEFLGLVKDYIEIGDSISAVISHVSRTADENLQRPPVVTPRPVTDRPVTDSPVIPPLRLNR